MRRDRDHYFRSLRKDPSVQEIMEDKKDSDEDSIEEMNDENDLKSYAETLDDLGFLLAHNNDLYQEEK